MDRIIRGIYRCDNFYCIINIWRIFPVSLVMVFSSIIIFLIEYWRQYYVIELKQSLTAKFKKNEFKSILENIHMHFIIIFRESNLLSMLSIEKKWHTFECLRISEWKTWIRFRYSQMDKWIKKNKIRIEYFQIKILNSKW